jgi:hypothetical protein
MAYTSLLVFRNLKFIIIVYTYLREINEEIKLFKNVLCTRSWDSGGSGWLMISFKRPLKSSWSWFDNLRIIFLSVRVSSTKERTRQPPPSRKMETISSSLALQFFASLILQVQFNKLCSLNDRANACSCSNIKMQLHLDVLFSSSQRGLAIPFLRGVF